MARLRSTAARLASVSLLGIELPLLVLWAALATVLSEITARVSDWNDMTDELVWERLAISVGQAHSVLPKLHGETIRSLSQLYPLLVSPFFWSGYVTHDLRSAHIFNAWLMSSAAIPAFLLARRVTERRWPAYALALVTVCIPWTMYSTAILTEVAAYPAFVWATFAMHRAIACPSKRNDALALVTIALAFLARTQFSLLLAVLPIALPLSHLSAAGGGVRDRARRALRSSLGDHPLLAGAYAALAIAALAYVAGGHHLTELSVYGKESQPSVFTTATAGSITGHAADLAFGLGILPFLVGTAWLLANALRPSPTPALHAFACMGAVLAIVLLIVVAAWDLTIGTFVLDRYLFYLTPVILLGFLCALVDARRPSWSLLVPAGMVSYGFAAHLQQSFLWSTQFPLSFDSPIAPSYRYVDSLAHGTGGMSAILVEATIVLAVVFVLANRFVRPAPLTAALTIILCVGLPAETTLTFVKLFSTNGHSGRPLTQPQSGILDWLDRAVGSGASVTEVPYPVSSSVFDSLGFWRDVEFWNKSVRYAVHYPTAGVFADATVWFPNTPLGFERATGAASASWSPYVLQSLNDSRFRISGNEQLVHSDVMLIDANLPWHTDWLTSGLYDDGWTEPHTTARIRVFPVAGQTGARILKLNIQIRAPEQISAAPFTLTSNDDTLHGTASAAQTSFDTLTICVPGDGYAEASLSTPLLTDIPGDEKSVAASTIPRRGGLLLADLSRSDDLGPRCDPKNGG